MLPSVNGHGRTMPMTADRPGSCFALMHSGSCWEDPMPSPTPRSPASVHPVLPAPPGAPQPRPTLAPRRSPYPVPIRSGRIACPDGRRRLRPRTKSQPGGPPGHATPSFRGNGPTVVQPPRSNPPVPPARKSLDPRIAMGHGRALRSLSRIPQPDSRPNRTRPAFRPSRQCSMGIRSPRACRLAIVCA